MTLKFCEVILLTEHESVGSFSDYFAKFKKRSLSSVFFPIVSEWFGPLITGVPQDVYPVLVASANVLSVLALLLVWNLRRVLRLIPFAIVSSAGGGMLVLAYLYLTATQSLSYSVLFYVGPITYSLGVSLLFSAIIALAAQDYLGTLRTQKHHPIMTSAATSEGQATMK